MENDPGPKAWQTLFLYENRIREADQRTLMSEIKRLDQRLDGQMEATKTALHAAQRNSTFIISGVGVLIAAFVYFMKG